MNTRLPRVLTTALLLGALSLSAASPANASPLSPHTGVVLAKMQLKDLAPKVTFHARARLKGTKASIQVSARIAVAGKTFTVPVLDMGIAKGKKSVTVKRKVGKLKVSLRVSWSGERQISISGSARYMKFKVPVPKIRIRI